MNAPLSNEQRLEQIAKLVRSYGQAMYTHGFHMSLAGDRWYQSDAEKAQRELMAAIKREIQ